MACFLAGHNREELIDEFCLFPFQHPGISSLLVAWDEPRQCLVGIRPRPLIPLKGSFKLCTPATCRGIDCTYPHSQVERDAWNYDKQMTKKGQILSFNLWYYYYHNYIYTQDQRKPLILLWYVV